MGSQPAPTRNDQDRQEVVALAQTAYTLTLDTIRATVRKFIMENFLDDGLTHELDDDASLVATGIVDATGVLELMLFVEDAYGIQVGDLDLDPENFDSINSITYYIARQLSNM